MDRDATGVVTEGLKNIWKQNQENVQYTVFKKTAVLVTSNTISKVLQSETWNLSGGVHHWFKRSTGGNETVIRDE
jgi:hypothetical protein